MKDLEIVAGTSEEALKGLGWDGEVLPVDTYIKKPVRSERTPMDIKDFLDVAVAECLPRIGNIRKFRP